MLALILAAAAAAAAAAPPPAARPSVITQPDWLLRPAAEDMANDYPKAAAAANVEGRATIACRVTAEGALAGCAVTEESPPGQGFGEAALKLAAKFRMRPMTKDGVPVDGGKINIPINFRLPKDQMPSLLMATRCYGFAAAEAERDPTSARAQMAVIAWRFVLGVRSYPEHPRPSEFEQMLMELRKSGAAKLDDAASKADRDECAAQIPANSGMLRNLETMARQ
jgi:TonB family protein